jgi:phosphoenolpyruvate carboxylase
MAPERDRLSDEIHRLGDLLGETIVEQEGRPLFDLVEEVRGLAKAHRAGDEAAGERLLGRLEALPLAESRGVVKAFATYFQLVNLAEEQERLRVLRAASGRPTPGAARRRRRSARRSGAAERGCRGGGAAGAPRPAAGHAGLHRAPDRGETAHGPHEARPDRGAAPRPRPRVKDARGGGDRARDAARGARVAVADRGDPDLQARVMDEVRNGLYYFETTLYDLAPDVTAALERRWSPSATRARACRPASSASEAGSAAIATATPS